MASLAPSSVRRPSAEGFGLIELLIVVALLTLTAAGSAPLYASLQTSTQMAEGASQLVQTMRTARERAVSRRNDAAHGVYLQSDRYTLYQGASYASRATAHDRVVMLDNAVTLSTTISGSEVNFSRGRGEPSATGSVTLRHAAQGTRTITIDAIGSVQQ